MISTSFPIVSDAFSADLNLRDSRCQVPMFWPKLLTLGGLISTEINYVQRTRFVLVERKECTAHTLSFATCSTSLIPLTRPSCGAKVGPLRLHLTLRTTGCRVLRCGGVATRPTLFNVRGA